MVRAHAPRGLCIGSNPTLEAPTYFLLIGCTLFDRVFLEYCGGGPKLDGTHGAPPTKRVRYSRV